MAEVETKTPEVNNEEPVVDDPAAEKPAKEEEAKPADGETKGDKCKKKNSAKSWLKKIGENLHFRSPKKNGKTSEAETNGKEEKKDKEEKTEETNGNKEPMKEENGETAAVPEDCEVKQE